MFGCFKVLVCGVAFFAGCLGTVNGAFAKSELPAAPQVLIDQRVIAGIKEWLKNPVVDLSINSKNERRKGLSSDEIDKLDQQWRKEREATDQPLIAATLNNPLSSYLTQIQAKSNGLYSEIFVMDAIGLNVGQSSITSDFWQGDEAKFQKTYPFGPDAVFIDEAEYNEETDSWRAQLNMTIANDANKAIGAITVEVNLNELARQKQLIGDAL